MNKVVLFLMVSCFTVLNGFSQTNNNSSFNYQYLNIESTFLKANVDIVISLPVNYKKEKIKYPVVYVLDGKWFFSQAVTTQLHAKRYKQTPDFIVVGIENTTRQRSWFMKGASKFNQFLEKELITTIHKKFRANNERLLFGWEASGGFVFDALGANSNLFSGYLAASPIPIDNSFITRYQYRLDAIKEVLKKKSSKRPFLYFATGKSDFPSQYGVDNMLTLLNKEDTSALDWEYTYLKDEKHPTAGYKTLNDGILKYFSYFPVLRFSTTKEFVENGNMKAVKTYYKERLMKYQFSEAKNTKDYLNTCRGIVFIAMNEKNYKVFDNHVQSFLPQNMLDATHYNHAAMFADFYLKNNNTIMAAKLMNFYTSKFPKAARPFAVLGKVFQQEGNREKARAFYLKAIDLGTKSSDRRLQEYKNSLANLK